MSVTVNIQHLEKHSLHLEDEVSPGDLDLQSRDELIRFDLPVRYRLEVQKVDQGILAQGTVSVEVECDCARCLKTFAHPIVLTHWAVHLPLEGEDCVPVVNDCVDLTPYVREDILLALPQHPLCSNDCRGLLREYGREAESPPGRAGDEDQTSPWGDLDKLDL